MSTKKNNKKQEMKREERRRKATQIRNQKREEVVAKKRGMGGADNAPFLTAVIPLGESANVEGLLNYLKSCDEDAKIHTNGRQVLHIQYVLISFSFFFSLSFFIFFLFFFYSLPRFRQRFSLIIPTPGDLYAALDACKVVDCVLFLLSPAKEIDSAEIDKASINEGDLGFDQMGEELLAAIMAQGLPTPIFVLNDFDVVPMKKRSDFKKNLQKQLNRMIPIEKLHVVEKESDALRLLHQIGSQKLRPIYQRDIRSHLLSEEVNFKQNTDDPTVGSLVVDGFIRYQPLNVNGLVHIPGWGDFQMDRIEVEKEPGEFVLLEEANPSLQESLKSQNDPDPMNGEQTWPYQEEMDGQSEMETAEDGCADVEDSTKKKKNLPKGTSEYQAAWIKDASDIEGDGDEDDASSDDDDYEDMSGSDKNEEDSEDSGAEEDNNEEMESEDNSEEIEGDDHQYDKKVCFAEEEQDFKRIKGISICL